MFLPAAIGLVRKIKKSKGNDRGEPHAKASIIIITFHGVKIKLTGNQRANRVCPFLSGFAKRMEKWRFSHAHRRNGRGFPPRGCVVPAFPAAMRWKPMAVNRTHAPMIFEFRWFPIKTGTPSQSNQWRRNWGANAGGQ